MLQIGKCEEPTSINEENLATEINVDDVEDRYEIGYKRLRIKGDLEIMFTFAV